jgi:endonuclease/exonuclease/phosphatase family metal-dependent hydrolase
MTLTVLCYNTQRGGEHRLPAIAEVVRAQHADVVCLVEANDRTNTETLATELGMTLVITEANSPHHLAWLSHLPLLRAVNHRLPSLNRTVLEVTVCWTNQPVRLFATHLA